MAGLLSSSRGERQESKLYHIVARQNLRKSQIIDRLL
jgi:hypothetical protein